MDQRSSHDLEVKSPAKSQKDEKGKKLKIMDIELIRQEICLFYNQNITLRLL
jgi:hypothetical protein